MTFNNWNNVLLKDVILFNPRESIKKGAMAKKIGMSRLNEFDRTINGYEVTEFKSGTKFRNGDTLLARITPCLENGKTAQVNVLDDEVGFGSTEFIVLRKKEGVTDKDYIFYLAISDKFRQIAIKSMTGTTGRQRAQKDVLENTNLSLPSIKEQKAIAKILSSLDDKIEVNNQINETLEKMAQALFKEWFVDFEFPNEDGEPYKSSGGEMVESEDGLIPKGWTSSSLKDISGITSGKRPNERKEVKSDVFKIPLAGASSIMGYTKDFNFDSNILIIGRVGTHGVIQRFQNRVWASDNTLVISSDYYEFVYQILKSIDYKSLNRGSTQPLITQKDIKNYKIVIPEKLYLDKYEQLSKKLFSKVNSNNFENKTLKEIRDTLLPKLMSGEIRVPIDETEESLVI